MTPDQPNSTPPNDPEKASKAVPVPTPLPSDQPKAVPIPTPMRGDDDDGEVDFGSLPDIDMGSAAMSRSQLSGPLSGTSIVSWADLMKARSGEEGGFDLDGPESIDFDADSDRDILAKVLSEEPPSGKLKVDQAIDVESDDPRSKDVVGASSDALGTGRRARDSVISEIVEDDEESSSIVGRSGDSSDVNLHRDIKAKIGSSQELQRTAEVDSPIVLSPDDDDATAEIGAIPVGGIESSAVDLGSQSVIDLPFPLGDSKNPMPSSGRRSKPRSGGSSQGDSGAVDLLGGARGTGLSSVPGLTAVADDARADSQLPATTPVNLAASRGGGWVNGVLGGLAGVALCVGVWMSGALNPSPAGKVAPKAATPPVDIAAAVNWLDVGELDRSIDALSKLPASPEVSSTLGQARVLRVLRQSKSGKPADAEEIKLAEADLKAAETARATLWLGLLQEAQGKTDAAKDIYREALGRFKDQSRLFQAALDRLDTRPAGPGPRAMAQPFGAAVFTLLLQVEPGTPDEAGFEFWKAIRLAKVHKYSEAQAALKLAREAHDARRLALARKGLNPESDPLEEIFLRCCDELRDYWAIRGQLNASIDLTKQPSPGAALSAVLGTSRTKTEEAKTLSTRLAAIRDALSQSGLDLNDLPAAVNKLVKAKEVADAAVKVARDGQATAERNRASAEADAAKLKSDLQSAMKKQGDLESELAKTREQIAGMKKPAAGPTDNADVAKLRDERGKLEAKAKELEDQLVVAKQQVDRVNSSARELQSFLTTVRQKIQAPPETRPADVLTSLETILATKPSRPDLPATLPGAVTSDPRAERAFARGLGEYRAGDLTAAEKSFASATMINSMDARYWYFLGLARSGLGKSREASADFQQGIDRERRNLPNAGVVDAALERLPADARLTLNQARGKF